MQQMTTLLSRDILNSIKSIRDMKKNYESEYIENELTHPWFKARTQLFLSILPQQKNLKILDYGCGTGNFLNALKNNGYYNLLGVEVSKNENFNKGSFREIQVKSSIPKDHKYDLILMMDVLEHIEDDCAIINILKSHLNPKGKLIISVPAYQFLWSKHDEDNMHYRRYCKKSLQRILNKCDLSITWIRYWNSLLFPFIAINRLINKNINNEQNIKNSFLSKIVFIILRVESFLLPQICFPFGLSVIASCTNE